MSDWMRDGKNKTNEKLQEALKENYIQHEEETETRERR